MVQECMAVPVLPLDLAVVVVVAVVLVLASTDALVEMVHHHCAMEQVERMVENPQPDMKIELQIMKVKKNVMQILVV